MKIEVSPDGETEWTKLALPYDPDTPFSVLGYDVLSQAGIRPQSLEEVRVAGVVQDRNVGTAYFRYRDRIVRSTVVFAHVEDPRTWGWHAVYYLGWEIDPASRKLRQANLDRPSPGA